MVGRLTGAVLIGAMLSAGASQAGTINYFYGDEDCFGTDNPSCPDTTIPPELEQNFKALYGQAVVEPYTPATGVGDPGGQDDFNVVGRVSGRSLTWTHTVSLAGLNITGAAICLRTGGLADLKGPYPLLINDVVIGEIPRVTGRFEELYQVKLFTFPFDPALLVEGPNTVA